MVETILRESEGENDEPCYAEKHEEWCRPAAQSECDSANDDDDEERDRRRFPPVETRIAHVHRARRRRGLRRGHVPCSATVSDGDVVCRGATDTARELHAHVPRGRHAEHCVELPSAASSLLCDAARAAHRHARHNGAERRVRVGELICGCASQREDRVHLTDARWIGRKLERCLRRSNRHDQGCCERCDWLREAEQREHDER